MFDSNQIAMERLKFQKSLKKNYWNTTENKTIANTKCIINYRKSPKLMD